MTRLRYPDYTGRGRRGLNGEIHARRIPERHQGLAAELDYRDDVECAVATPTGVDVRLAPDVAELPAWIHEKADILGIGLDLEDAPPDRPDAASLRARREAAGLSQADVADTLGVHESLVGKVERGVRVLTPTRAASMAGAIGAQTAADGGGSDAE